jgi:signal transduction histidine kinase
MKSTKELRLRPLIIFYILLFYIVASLVWWTYLLLGNTAGNFKRARDNLSAQFPGMSTEDLTHTPSYLEIKHNYDRQRLMIYGEGVIFLTLLVLGAARIRKSYIQEVDLSRQQRNFLLSITHELKSPLSSIRLALQTLQKADVVQAQREQLLKNAIEDADRLQSLVEDILLAARFEDQAHTFDDEPLDMSSLVSEVSHSKFTPASVSRLHVDTRPGIVVNGDRQALAIVIGNLVDNAIKYAPPGSPIHVSLAKSGESALLTVSDRGPGISGRERKKVFRKFYRVGNEETRRTSGTGLGLFIVKQIVERHHGKVSITDTPGGGSSFQVVIPAAR